jgi:restriction endonuclease, S subunit
MNRYERYKDSGIPWLGEVPAHWDTMSLKYICDVRDGTHDTPKYVYESDNSYPLVTSKDISNGNINFESAKFISEEDYLNISKRSNVNFGDLLMPMIGTVGGSVLVETYRKFTIKNVALFKAGQFCAKWLKYFLDSELSKIQFELEKNGGVQDFVGLTTLRNLIILKLPLKEQTAIAHYLDTKLSEIDALIDKQQTLLEKLAEQRTAVITHAVTKGLNPAAPMKNSGVEWLGNVPAHWDVKRLKFLITELRVGPFGSAIKISDYVQDGKPLYNQRTVLDNSFANNSIFLTDEKYKELNSFQTKSGDFLLTTRGTIGKVAIVPQNAEPGIIHPCLIRFKIDENLFQPKLLKSIFNETDFFKKQLDLKSNATTIDVIYSNSLKELFLTLPPRDEQAVIADYLDQKTTKIYRLCDTVNQTIGRLKEYRTALITQAVTGKIKVTDE